MALVQQKWQWCGWGWWQCGEGHRILCSFQLVNARSQSPSSAWPGTQPLDLLSTPIPRRQWGLLKPLRLFASWILSGPCFLQPKLLSWAPKEVFFSSEWIWRMMEPSLICSCPCLLRRALVGGGIALVCLSCLCSLEAPSRDELEDYCSWGPLPPPRPKTNEGKTGIFFFHKETHFCICDREGIYFKPAFFGDNRNIVLSEKNYKYKKIQERLTSIHNTTLHFCAFFQSYVLIFK